MKSRTLNIPHSGPAAVMSLGDVKKRKEREKAEASMRDYLKILSFGELIDETSMIIREINSKPLTKELASRSKMVLKELGLRIDEQSKSFDTSLESMRSSLEKKILEIQGLL